MGGRVGGGMSMRACVGVGGWGGGVGRVARRVGLQSIIDFDYAKH